MIFNSFGLVTSRDVVQTKKVWKRTQKLGIFKQLQTDFKGVFNKVMKNVWERRSHAFPPHYTPGYKGIDIYVVMRFSHCAIFEKESGFILLLLQLKLLAQYLKDTAKFLFYFIDYQINNL